MIAFLILAASAWAMVFLKALQSQNVIHGHYWAATIVSVMVAVAEVALITSVATRGWDSLAPVMIGGTAGVLMAMVFHRKYIRRTA